MAWGDKRKAMKEKRVARAAGGVVTEPEPDTWLDTLKKAWFIFVMCAALYGLVSLSCVSHPFTTNAYRQLPTVLIWPRAVHTGWCRGDDLFHDGQVFHLRDEPKEPRGSREKAAVASSVAMGYSRALT
jgi:hypothetical protein